jgi:hypothetical protein
MTAALAVADRPALRVLDGGRGRPSASRLGEMRELIEDMRDELQASLDERREFATFALAVARRSQVALANGHSPASLLDELERRSIREGLRILSAGVEPEPAA